MHKRFFFSKFTFNFFFATQIQSPYGLGWAMSLDWEPWYNQLATEINSQRKIIKTYKNS
jgi:hypothetical protein